MLESSVEGQAMPVKSGCKADVLRTDEKAREAAVASEQQQHTKETYADVVRKRIGDLKTVVESARRMSTPRTLLN